MTKLLGKRKPRRIQKSYNPYLLILNGWGYPTPSSMYGEAQTQNGITIKKSLYPSYDKRYKTDFNAVINKYEKNFLADYREQKSEVIEDAEIS